MLTEEEKDALGTAIAAETNIGLSVARGTVLTEEEKDAIGTAIAAETNIVCLLLGVQC